MIPAAEHSVLRIEMVTCTFLLWYTPLKVFLEERSHYLKKHLTISLERHVQMRMELLAPL